MIRVALRVAPEEPLPHHGLEPADVRAWLKQFLEWTTVWANDPTVHDRVEYGQLRFIDVDGATAYGYGGKNYVGNPIRVRSSRALGHEQLIEAAAKASAAERLPLEHRLLLDAFHSHDLRRAVNDAATAVEVALSGSMIDWLTTQGMTAGVAEKLLPSANGLMGLSRLHQKLGVAFRPGGVSGGDFRRLCEVRNDAAHRGVIERDGFEVVDTAACIVDFLRPLPR